MGSGVQILGKLLKEDIPHFYQDFESGLTFISSLYLEVKTGKRHDNILRDIDSIKRSEQNFGKLNFEDSSYKQFTQTREYLFYWMTEDGFSVLMGGYSIAHRIEIQKELRLYKDGLKGSYLIEDPIKRAYKWIEEQQERQKAIETVKVLELDNKIKDQTIKEYTPKVSYYDLKKVLYIHK